MKQLLLIILFFLPFTINSQIYNSTDTTWTVTYNQVLKIRQIIESCKNSREVLEKEIDCEIVEATSPGYFKGY